MEPNIKFIKTGLVWSAYLLDSKGYPLFSAVGNTIYQAKQLVINVHNDFINKVKENLW